jgi:hypothetical protein
MYGVQKEKRKEKLSCLYRDIIIWFRQEKSYDFRTLGAVTISQASKLLSKYPDTAQQFAWVARQKE